MIPIIKCVYLTIILAKIRCSILILHGLKDEIIAYKHSVLLYERFFLLLSSRCISDRMSFESTVDLILMENVYHNDVKKILNLKIPKASIKFGKWLKRLESMETVNIYTGYSL